MLFWSAIAVLSLGSSLLLWRSWRANIHSRDIGSGSDLALAQIRLSEIEQDVVDGRLDVEAATAAKTEEARRLLRAARDDADDLTVASSKPSGWWMTGTLVLVPFLSVLLYVMVGDPPSQRTEPVTSAQVEEQSMDQLIATAERRLEQKPDDLNGWKVLAPVYLRQNELQKAETALRNIIRLDGADSYTYSTLAEILISRRNGEVLPEALELFKTAAQADPANATARYYVGVAAVQRGDLQTAKVLWQTMLEDADGQEEWIPTIKKRLSDLEDIISRTESQEIPDPAEILQLPKDEQQAQIEGMVAALASRLAENPNDQDGWRMLVRAYTVLDRSEDARDAIASAQEAFPEDARFLEELLAMLTPQEPTEETE